MIVIPAARIEEMKAAGWWNDTTFDDLLQRNVAERPDAEALVDPVDTPALVGRPARRLTWREVGDAVDRMAAVLTARGIGKDQVVMVQLPNIAELTVIYLACARLGVIVSPAPVQYREHELAYIGGKTNAVAAITAARIGREHPGERLSALRDRLPGLRDVLVIGEPCPVDALNLDRLLAETTDTHILAAEAAARRAAATADDVVTICWTSGTEAEPKGVPRSHNEWLIAGTGVIEAAELAPGTRLLNPFPMVNMAGISTCVAAWLVLGGVLVQHHPFDLALFLQQIRDEAIDYTVAPPAVLTLLLRDEALLSGIDFARLKSIGSGSAPLSEWMVRTFHERHGVQIVNYFGSNEGASLTSTQRNTPDPAQRAVLFAPADGGRMRSRLVDPDSGREIDEAGRPGELRIKGPTVFSGYWRAPELNAAAFDDDGWFRTGDLFEFAGDDRCHLRLVGRLKDIVVRGGMKISSEEIERHLLAHPAVAEAAVVGKPDDRLGERLAAFVVFRSGMVATLAELNAFLTGERRVAVYKRIEQLEAVDSLPRNPIGKVLKRDLRQTLS